MAGDYPDWTKPRTLDALPNSLLYYEGEEVVTVGNVEGNRDGAAVPAGYRRIITNWWAVDHDGSRPFNFIVVRGASSFGIGGGATTGSERPVHWQGYEVLQAGDFVRTRHYIGTGANRISWHITGWDVPV